MLLSLTLITMWDFQKGHGGSRGRLHHRQHVCPYAAEHGPKARSTLALPPADWDCTDIKMMIHVKIDLVTTLDFVKLSQHFS